MDKSVSNKMLKNAIRNIADFPIKGIQFKDITTLLRDKTLFNHVIDEIVDYYKEKHITQVAAIESRGFMLGGAISNRLGAGFVPIRKPGKLPADVYRQTYQLEYGEDALEIHQDALVSGDTVLLHDDLLATGGTSLAALELLKKFNVHKVYIGFLIELDFLNGRENLKDYDVFSVIHF